MQTTKTNNVFLDTNILVRATIKTAPLHQEAQSLLNQLWQSESQLWVSPQVLREYFSTLTRPQTYSYTPDKNQVIEQIRRFKQTFFIAEETISVSDQLLTLTEKVLIAGKQIHDANIVATMLVYKIDTLATHNLEDFKRFVGLITILPL